MKKLDLDALVRLMLIVFNVGEGEPDNAGELIAIYKPLCEFNGIDLDEVIFDNEGAPMGTGVKGLYERFYELTDDEAEEFDLSYINDWIDSDNPTLENLIQLIEE